MCIESVIGGLQQSEFPAFIRPN